MGWWTECAQPKASSSDVYKLSVVCGAFAEQFFVKFVENDTETFCQDDLSGVFVKVAGPHAARRFSLPELSIDAGTDAWASALAPVNLWVDMVQPGVAVLIAFLCIPPEAMGPLLAALVPLGFPQVPPPNNCLAFAAVGSRPTLTSKSHSEHSSDLLFATHAGTDVAYASMYVDASVEPR